MATWTESELEAEILVWRTAISNIAKTGKRYEIGTGSSKIVFEAADLKDMREYLYDLEQQLRDLNETSGVNVGF